MYKNNRENFYKTFSKLVECDKSNHPIIFEKSIPTKPQKRGNCALKARNVLIREILRRTDSEMVFNNVDGKQSGKGYEFYQSYKKLLTEDPINKLVELADPAHGKDFIPIITIKYTFEIHLFGLKFRKKTFCIS